MKRLNIVLVFIFSLVISPIFLVSPAQAEEVSHVRIVWDGQELVFPDQQPTIINGVTLAPSRPLVAMMPVGHEVNIIQDSPWWAVSIQSHQSQDTYHMAFYQGHDNNKPFYTLDYGTLEKFDKTKSQRVEMTTPIQIMGGRLMLPVRALTEPFGTVAWDASTQTITITSNK